MSAQRDLGQSMLQVVFSFFLGLVVTAFIGIGVTTFYPEPTYSPGGDRDWNTYRLTISIILLICATLVMLLSLTITRTGTVLANGALLGGLFTMILAVGMGISIEQQWPRFMVIAIALAITVAVGWWRFSRRGLPAASGAVPAGALPGEAGVLPGEAEARLAAVEAKLGAVARALRD